MASDPNVTAASLVTELALTDTCIQGDFIGFDGTNWVRSDADAATPIRAEFIALNACRTSGDTIKVCKKAVLFDADAPYTKGALQFASGTAGKHTETNPIAALVNLQVVGRALKTDTAMLDCEVPHYVAHWAMANTAPATAANFGSIWVAPVPLRFIGGYESHAVVGSDGSAVTLDIEKLAATQALDAGTVITSGTVSLKATADTPQVIAPHATAATARVAAGQRVALKDAGTLTALAGVVVTLVFVPDL